MAIYSVLPRGGNATWFSHVVPQLSYQVGTGLVPDTYWCSIIILTYLMHTLRQDCTFQSLFSESPRKAILCSTRFSGFKSNVEKFQNTSMKIFIFHVQTGSVCFKLWVSMHIQSLKQIRPLKENNLLTLIIPLQL